VPNELLEWSYREDLIVKHILDSNADVVCLEEVDKFTELMARLGQIYNGHCVMKPDGMMGCAVLWHKERVQQVSAFKSVQFMTEDGQIENQLYVYAELQHVIT
jgi:mRNA deadenylase 3'-5' endonuclease subunit Ccr4